jgi:hypothetical protein
MARHNHRFVPSDVTTPLLIEAGDVQIDAYGTYDVVSGSLETVIINGRKVSPDKITAALNLICPQSIGPWDDDLDGAKINELLNEDAENAACDWADWQRDMNMEAMQ